MEGHNDMDARRESSDNIVIGELGEDENEIKSVGDDLNGGASENKSDPSNSSSKSTKKKKCIRHNANQIEELELAFKHNTHPDRKALLELAMKLSIDYKKVQYWFQNKRARVKSKLNCNEKLRAENISLKEAIEGTNIINVASQKGVDSGNVLSSPLPIISPWPTISLTNEDVTYDKSMLMNHSLAAMNELVNLAMVGEPLWVRSLDGGGEMLNVEEYARLFTSFTCMKSRYLTTEATRASGRVMTDSTTIVEAMMDKNLWAEMFPCIIRKISIFDVISTGVGESKSGILLLIKTELQMISDLAPVREITFLRYCHQHARDIWIVVDVSIDIIKEGSQQCEISNCRRLPSGCIVQDMLNGYSQVTWIEHMEYNEDVVHHLYRPVIRTGLGFGAQRWMATLQRQFEFLGSMMLFNDPTVYSNGEKSIGMLAQRMTHNFCAGVCATTHQWEIVSLEKGEDVKLMKRNNNIGEPSGTVLSATKTIWLRVKQQRLFEFLINEQTRSQWDVLSNCGIIQLMTHISKGQNIHSNISLFHANGDGTSTNQNNKIILQDTCTDATGSLLVYATIDSLTIDSDLALFPCGIAIAPDFFHDYSDNGFCTGSLVTIGFQILVESFHSKNQLIESATKASGIISGIINGIKTSLECK